MLPVVLFGNGRQTTGVVLDPTDSRTKAALERWRAEGCVRLVPDQHGVGEPMEARARFDGIVALGMGCRPAVSPRTFAAAISDYAAVERLLGRLADTWRVRWCFAPVEKLAT